MREAVAPLTRLSATAEAPGWTKLTCASLPMSKPCQLMITFWLDWVTSIRAPLVAMLALPTSTLPPVGKASGDSSAAARCGANPSTTATLASPVRTRAPDFLPPERASSDATTQALRRRFQTRR